MPTLLVQSCSNRKQDVAGEDDAIDIYDGYFFRIIKKAMREDDFRDDIDICILSAEYGLIEEETEISPYDREISPSRAEELSEEVTNEIISRVDQENYEELILNVGNQYERALSNLNKRVSIPVHAIQGDGIGEKGSTLKRVVRGEMRLSEAEQ